MRAKVINSSELADTRCWSASRFLDRCQDCGAVLHCKVEQAKAGRVKYYERKVSHLQQRVRSAQKKLKQAQQELMKEQNDGTKSAPKTR